MKSKFTIEINLPYAIRCLKAIAIVLVATLALLAIGGARL